MAKMTARQPRRTRRRVATAALPRPAAMAEPMGAAPEPARSTPAAVLAPVPRRHVPPREHHVERDFGYVRRDLLLVAGVGSVVIAFIVGVSFLF